MNCSILNIRFLQLIKIWIFIQVFICSSAFIQAQNSCNISIYDTGGPNASYAANQSTINTYCADSGNQIQLEFSAFQLEHNFDFLYIYDGSDVNSPLLGAYTGFNSPQTIQSTGECLTLHFTSDASNQLAGYEAFASCGSSCNFTIDNLQITHDVCDSNAGSVLVNVSPSGNYLFSLNGAPAQSNPYFFNLGEGFYQVEVQSTIGNCFENKNFFIEEQCMEICGNNIDDDNDGEIDEGECHQIIYTCDDRFYDNGGPNGEYAFDTHEVTTYCSPNETQIQAIFETFDLDLGVLPDTLLVYDGVDVTSPLLGKYYGRPIVTGNELRINSLFQSTSGCLTFEFKSGQYGVREGWEAQIYCTTSITNSSEICGNGIDDDGDGWVDFQDGECEEIDYDGVCQNTFTYYIPPVWQMNGNPVVYSNPGILCISTNYPSSNIQIETADQSYQKSMVTQANTIDTIFYENHLLKTKNRNTVESNKGLIIESDFPLNVYYILNGYINKNFMTIKGNEAKGKSFVAASQTNTLVHEYENTERAEHHFVSVMATEDNTQVDFLFTRRMKGIQSPHSVTLNRGQSYIVTDDDYNVTVSGVKVKSDKDIVAVSGSQHTNIYNSMDDDGGVDMLVPVKNLGNQFVLVRGGVNSGHDYGIVVSAENNTSVYVNGSNEAMCTLNSGEFVNIPLQTATGEAMYIETSKNAYVYHVSGQVESEVGMGIVPAIGECRGDKKISFKRFNMTERMTLQLVVPTAGISSMKLNQTPITTIPQVIINNVPGLNGYSAITIENDHIAEQNEIISNEYFQAALLIGDATNTGSIAFISSFSEKVNVLDPHTGFPVDAYVIDTICSNNTLEHTLEVQSCGTLNKILGVEGPDNGTITLTGGLSFEYENNGTKGTDMFSLLVGNDEGIKTKICLSVEVTSLYAELNKPFAIVCAFDTTLLKIDTIENTGPFQYIWSTGETTPTITVNPQNTTVYTVTITDSRMCSTELSSSLEVLPSIISEAGPEQSVCFGDQVMLDAIAPDGTSGHWSGGQGVFQNMYNPKSNYTPTSSEKGTSFYLYWTITGNSGQACFIGKDSVFITVTEVLDVYAGQDASVCTSQPFNLSYLDAQLNSSTIQEGEWKTNGDGYFMPGEKSIGSFNESTHYQPGPQDYIEGEVILTLSAEDPGGAPECNYDFDEVMLTVQEAPLLVCNDNLNISLNKVCQLEVTGEMVLEDPIEPFENYIVSLTLPNGAVIPNNIINSSHIGLTIDYEVHYSCGSNSCWGSFMVEDKHIPMLTCQDTMVSCLGETNPDVIGLPVDDNLNEYKQNNKYIVEGFDGCSNVILEYEDEVDNLECTDDYQAIIYRTWEAIDAFNNFTSCTQTIYIERITFDEVSLPSNYDDNVLPSFSCTDDIPLTAQGYPSPEITGSPSAGNCIQMESTYTDLFFPLCGSGYKIVREWKIFDWCTSTFIEHFQIIMVVDKNPPVAICPQDVTISTDQYSCKSGLYLIELPAVSDDCSETEITVEVIDSLGIEYDVTNTNGNLIVYGLPIGVNTAIFSITDECGNVTECSYEIEVQDLIAPTLVCDSHTKISIINNGIGRLYAESVDDGAYDNCELLKLEIRKMTDSCGFGTDFGAYVDFCCEEIGTIQQVVVKATDIYGNYNHCMAEVEVEDKLAPFIQAPDDLTISCENVFDLDDLDPFGTIAFTQAEREDIIIYDAFNDGVAGKDGIAIDNCEVSVEETVSANIDCGSGTIVRSFTATDAYGNNSSDVQTITIMVADPFSEEDITWPSDTITYGCKILDANPDLIGRPEFTNQFCSSISTSYDDKIFTSTDSACIYILRTWSVLDICQFQEDENTGLWENIQSIKLNNSIAPEFISPAVDTTICTYGECGGEVTIAIEAQDDCTEDQNLVYFWELDIDNDGILDEEGIGNEFDIYLENGDHKVLWTVQDGCGNIRSKSYIVTTDDCKDPTPYCITDISTAVMDQTGEVTIWAEDFNLSSSDNCTPTQELIYSFSSDTSQTSITITCDSLLNGVSQEFELQMWVTDLEGNQDYCSVQLLVEDNIGICPDNNDIQFTGTITSVSNQAIKDIEVDAIGLPEYSDMEITDNAGFYSFGSIPPSIDLTMQPYKNDELLNGVSTLDIIYIQKHILGLDPFDEPMQFIAGDVNHDEKISGSDIIGIRKVILGLNDEFTNNTSWRFLNKEVGFNDNLPYLIEESIEIKNISSSMNGLDFFGIKIGDVNKSIKFDVTDDNIESRSEIVLDVVQKGSQVIFKTNLPKEFFGMQMKIQIDRNLKVDGIDSEIIDLYENENYVYQDGSIVLQFNVSNPMSLDSKTEVLQVSCQSESVAKKLLESLKLMEGDFDTHWVDGNLVESNISLSKVNVPNNQLQINMKQNQPNPFHTDCQIEIESEKSAKALFRVVDQTGALIYEENLHLMAGKQWIQLTSEIISSPGLYHYQLITENELLSRSLIKI